MSLSLAKCFNSHKPSSVFESKLGVSDRDSELLLRVFEEFKCAIGILCP